MAQQALGMIETLGLIGALSAADAGAKAANVSLQKIVNSKGSGMMTVIFEGDVAAVQAAVEVGAAEARRVGQLLAAHVIARTAEGMAEKMDLTAPAAPAAGRGRRPRGTESDGGNGE